MCLESLVEYLNTSNVINKQSFSATNSNFFVYLNTSNVINKLPFAFSYNR